MSEVACPTNFLTARENYQIAKFKLRRTEDQLLAVFEVKTVADLEDALLRERSKRHPRFSDLANLYLRQHQELGAADELFEVASNLQRQRIAQMQNDNTYKQLDE